MSQWAYTHLPRSKQALISLEESSRAHSLSIFLLPTVLGNHGDRDGYNGNPDQDCNRNKTALTFFLVFVRRGLIFQSFDFLELTADLIRILGPCLFGAWEGCYP